MDYLKIFKEMISLRGLTEHTVTSYSTYIHAYLDYLIEPSIIVFLNSDFLHYMFFINHGITISFLCASSIIIFP
ncbi:MAG: hypothetical protein FWE25_05295, partial [Lachnospiraceae bacterium]|nr:hypothetical protein [Lachnospiraceae bacterium]